MADRKPDSYLGSATGAVAEAEVTAVVFEDSLYQGKAQARANGFGGEKGIGYVFKDRCADTTTGIENRQGHAVLLRRDFQGQGTALRHGINGIGKDVYQNLLNQFWIHLNIRRIRMKIIGGGYVVLQQILLIETYRISG